MDYRPIKAIIRSAVIFIQLLKSIFSLCIFHTFYTYLHYPLKNELDNMPYIDIYATMSAEEDTSNSRDNTSSITLDFSLQIFLCIHKEIHP